MKRIVVVLFLLAACVATASAEDVVNRVAAVVDNEVITLHEIETLAAPVIAQTIQEDPAMTQAQQAEAAAKIKQDVLQNLIEQKLIESEVVRLGIEVTDQEIDAYIERVKEANGYTDETLKLALLQQSMTMQDFRDRIKMEILRERYVSFRMRDKLRVRDEDIRAYYTQHPGEFAAEPVVRIAEIRFNVPPEATEAQLQDAFARANQVYEQLLAGGDFAAIAREFSQGPTASGGGVLGQFKLDTELSQVYRKAVLPLAAGQFSTIYRDRNGFVIVKLLEKSDQATLPFDEVKEKIRMILRKQQADREMERLGAELRKKSFVDIRINFAAPTPEATATGQ